MRNPRKEKRVQPALKVLIKLIITVHSGIVQMATQMSSNGHSHLTAKAKSQKVTHISQTLKSLSSQLLHHHQWLLLHQGRDSRRPPQALCPQLHVVPFLLLAPNP